MGASHSVECFDVFDMLLSAKLQLRRELLRASAPRTGDEGHVRKGGVCGGSVLDEEVLYAKGTRWCAGACEITVSTIRASRRCGEGSVQGSYCTALVTSVLSCLVDAISVTWVSDVGPLDPAGWTERPGTLKLSRGRCFRAPCSLTKGCA